MAKLGRPRKKRKYTKSAAYWGKGIKKGRGVKKHQKASKASKVSKVCTECDIPKKTRGRPRKYPLPVEVLPIQVHRQRGRPRKFKAEDGREPLATKTYRHLGFCSVCLLDICSADIKEKHTEYVCPRCGKVDKLKNLKGELGLDRPKTKRDYLATVNSVYSNAFDRGEKQTSKILPAIEETVEVAPLKDDEENILEEHDKDEHEKT